MNPRRAGLTTRVIALVVIVIIVLAGAVVYVYAISMTPENNVTMSLGFPPGPEHAPQYYSLQQGYFSSEGINASLLPGTGSLAAISAVSAGKVDFAIIDASALIFSLYSSNITNVKIVSVLYPASFYGIIYNKAMVSGLGDLPSKPGALINPSTSEETRLFLALATQNGLNITGNVQYSSSPAIADGSLTTGKVAWIEGGAQDVAFLQPAAAQAGIQLGFIPFSQLGFTSYGEVLITSTSMISSHSDIVRAFVLATMKGMVGAVLNPAGAASAENHYEPQLNSTQMLDGLNLDISCCLTGVTANTNPLVYGYVNPATMQTTVNFALTASNVSKQISASQFYTDAYTTAP